MKNIQKIVAFIIISSLLSCSKEEIKTITQESATGDAQIVFDTQVGNQDFALNTPFSINGASYEFTNLRYWISNVSLIDSENKAYDVPDSYYLMEETKDISVQGGKFVYPATKREVVDLKDIPSGSYTKIRFSVGIDETFNNNMSLQAGELSQLNGMTNVSWQWHTSYIFSSLKGKNTTTDTAILVETGLNTNYRTVEIALPNALVVSGSKTGIVNLSVDVAKIIANINLAATPVISAATLDEMTVVSDNFKNAVFTIQNN